MPGKLVEKTYRPEVINMPQVPPNMHKILFDLHVCWGRGSKSFHNNTVFSLRARLGWQIHKTI